MAYVQLENNLGMMRVKRPLEFDIYRKVEDRYELYAPKGGFLLLGQYEALRRRKELFFKKSR